MFDMQFRLTVLKELYESGKPLYAVSRQYGVSHASLAEWKRKYEKNLLPLPADLNELEKQVYMARKKYEAAQPQPQTESEKLKDEVERLRKALSYSELRNEGLLEVLKIGREQYGIDLLKKAGAKQ